MLDAKDHTPTCSFHQAPTFCTCGTTRRWIANETARLLAADTKPAQPTPRQAKAA